MKNIYENINFAGAIFDMDGLVFDTEKTYHKIWKTAAKDYGYDINEKIISGCVGMNRKGSSEYFKSVFGSDFPFDEISDTKNNLIDEIFKKEPPKIKNGFSELIAYFKENNIKTAIATSTHRKRTYDFLKSSNIFDAFDEIVCGDEVSNSKPAPDIFLTAANKIGIDIKLCIVFEDSFNGIIAANAAGAIPIMVPDTVYPTDEIISKCFRIQRTLWSL